MPCLLNLAEQNHIIIFGSFNMKPTASEFEPLIDCHYSPIIEQNTDIHSKNLQGSDCIDNIWLSIQAKTLNTSRIVPPLNHSETHLTFQIIRELFGKISAVCGFQAVGRGVVSSVIIVLSGLNLIYLDTQYEKNVLVFVIIFQIGKKSHMFIFIL